MGINEGFLWLFLGFLQKNGPKAYGVYKKYYLCSP